MEKPRKKASNDESSILRAEWFEDWCRTMSDMFHANQEKEEENVNEKFLLLECTNSIRNCKEDEECQEKRHQILCKIGTTAYKSWFIDRRMEKRADRLEMYAKSAWDYQQIKNRFEKPLKDLKIELKKT